MKKNIVLLLALFICTCSFAQGEIDAFRLSGNDLRGTARGQAMGGAFGALGGDVTGIMINPAGLGVYRTSEVNASLAFTSTNLKTDWNNSLNTQDKFKFNFDNISYVGYFPTGKEGANVINFAFSYNRLKNFDRRYTASSNAIGSSLTDYMVAITNGIDIRDLMDKNAYDYGDIPWLSILGIDGGFFDHIEGTNDEYTWILNQDETVAPKLNITERGYIEAYDFSLGTNLSDKLYLGATFSLTDIQYHLDSSYGETFEQGGSIGLNNYFETQGAGYQFNVGAIWRPVDALRLGVAYHSPTWYSLTDYYQGTVSKDIYTPEDAYTDYRFNNPYSWVFSAAGIIGTKAVVSLDYEIKDYTGMDLADNNGREYKSDNQYINEDFKTASTLRAGLEYRFTPQFSGRLGYSRIQNPYEEKFGAGEKEAMIVGTVPHYTIEGDVNYFTAGIGYRFTPQFYIDVAFVYKTQKDDLYAFPSVWDDNGNYIVESIPAKLTNNTYKGLVTVGYKF